MASAVEFVETRIRLALARTRALYSSDVPGPGRA